MELCFVASLSSMRAIPKQRNKTQISTPMILHNQSLLAGIGFITYIPMGCPKITRHRPTINNVPYSHNDFAQPIVLPPIHSQHEHWPPYASTRYTATFSQVTAVRWPWAFASPAVVSSFGATEQECHLPHDSCFDSSIVWIHFYSPSSYGDNIPPYSYSHSAYTGASLPSCSPSRTSPYPPSSAPSPCSPPYDGPPSFLPPRGPPSHPFGTSP